MDIFKHIRILSKSIFLNKNEICFINFCTKTKSNLKKSHKKKKFILIQTPSDYYYLAYYKLLLSENFFLSYRLIGLWPYFQRPVRKRFFVLEILQSLQLIQKVFRAWSFSED